MQLEKIISISGKPGLFTLVTQLRSGFIVEDISTGKKASISNTSQVSLLDNIAIYTFDQEVPLFEVMKNIAEKFDYKEAINHKSSENELKSLVFVEEGKAYTRSTGALRVARYLNGGWPLLYALSIFPAFLSSEKS